MNKILERVQNDRKNKISSAGLSGCGCGQSDVKFSRLSKFEVLSTEDLKGLLKSTLEGEKFCDFFIKNRILTFS